MEETWLYHYDPETKQNQWNGSIAAHPSQNIPSPIIGWKISDLDVWDQDAIVLIDYLPKGQTITADYY
jgi:hypothetical protein